MKLGSSLCSNRSSFSLALRLNNSTSSNKLWGTFLSLLMPFSICWMFYFSTASQVCSYTLRAVLSSLNFSFSYFWRFTCLLTNSLASFSTCRYSIRFLPRSSTISYIVIRSSVLEVISATTSGSIRISWFLWWPKSAQFEHMRTRSYIHMISSFRWCYGQRSSTAAEDLTLDWFFTSCADFSAKAFDACSWASLTAFSLSCCSFLIVFSASLIRAKFFGNSSAESFRSHSWLKLTFRVYFWLTHHNPDTERQRLQTGWAARSCIACSRCARIQGSSVALDHLSFQISVCKAHRLVRQTTL